MGDDPFKFGADDSQPTDPGGVDLSVPTGAAGLSSIRQKLNGSWLLVGLLAAGFAGLYGMSMMKGPSAASAEQMQTQSNVDEALAKLRASAGSGGKSTAEIVETFYCEARQRQIPASEVKSNPFVYRVVPPTPVEEPNSAPALTAAAKTVEPGVNEALAAAKLLRLQSVVMGSRQTAAMISDNLLTEGQSIHGWTVTKILPREVHLSWKDQSYVLRMSE